ncbi:hypothetical protein QPK87_00485 [Kamptonema cortianum]|nr:hypothetical protein [Kamptonema cortianum]
MRHRIIKTCFVFLLMMTFLISSAVAIKTQEELLEALDLEDTRVILRALNNKFKVDWSSVKSNHPKHREETQKILNFLTFILDKRIKETDKLFLKRSQVLNNLILISSCKNGMLKRTNAYEEIKARLRGNCKDSKDHTLYKFEYLSLRTPPNTLEAPPAENTSDSAINADSIVSDFVIIEDDLVGHEISIKADFSPVCPLSEFISFPLASNSSTLGCLPEVTPAPLVGSSSTAEYPPEIAPPQLLCSPSASSDVDEDPESLCLRNESENCEELLLALDERDVKITLQAMLNNYLIPLDKFNPNGEGEENRYKRIRAYLSWVLLKKSEKALLKKINLTSSDAERSEFKSGWYDIKCAYYQNSMERMWDSSCQLNFWHRIF